MAELYLGAPSGASVFVRHEKAEKPQGAPDGTRAL